MQVVTISSQRQITLPKAILDALSVAKKDKLLIRIEDKKLIAKPISKSIVAETAGSLRKYIRKEKLDRPFKEIMQVTKKATARKLIQND